MRTFSHGKVRPLSLGKAVCDSVVLPSPYYYYKY